MPKSGLTDSVPYRYSLDALAHVHPGHSFMTGSCAIMSFIDQFQLSVPLILAPMAGVATPSLAAAVSEAGALGSIGVGATDAAGARMMIEEVRSRTTRAFNVNLFVHAGPKADPSREAEWLRWLTPLFVEYNAEPPKTLKTIYKSFADDPEMLSMLLDLAPPVVSIPVSRSMRHSGVSS